MESLIKARYFFFWIKYFRSFSRAHLTENLQSFRYQKMYCRCVWRQQLLADTIKTDSAGVFPTRESLGG